MNTPFIKLFHRIFIASSVMMLAFTLPASARKIYPNKASDGGIYLNEVTLSYSPGDTIVLRASQNPYAYFSLDEIHGRNGAIVVIMNEGGQVNVGAMAARHCTYLKFTGTGSADQYGFYLTSPNQTVTAPAIELTGRTSDIEVDH